MPKKTKKAKQPQVSTAQMLLALVAVLVVAVLGIVGWQWRAGLMVEQVVVQGEQHADPLALIEMARVDTSWHMYAVAPDTLADRIIRHPWVEAADVRRLPTGTLII